MTKMYKTLILALCALLALSLPLAALAEAPDTELEGHVTEVVDGGFLMEDKELGQVMLNVDDQTVLDGILMESALEAGQYVIVTYDGKLTRSIPPQAHADKVGCYVLQGTAGEFLETGVMLMNDAIFGDVLVHVGDSAKHIYPNVPITVYYDGVMAMSLPGQVAAREIVVPELFGTASDLDDKGFTLTDEQGTAYRVLVEDSTLIGELVAADPEETDGTEETPEDENQETLDKAQETPDELPEDAEPSLTGEEVVTGFETINYDRALAEGDWVTVYYNGDQTEGEPIQVTALEVLAVLNRE